MAKPKTALVPPDNVRRRYAEVLPTDQALALEVLFALRSSVQNVDNVLSRWLGSDAVTPGRLQVLVVLWSKDAPIPQREIVEALRVSRATVSDLIELLARESLVTATPSASDRRQVLVALTASGREFTERLVRENGERLRGVFGNLGRAELKMLISLLRRLPRSDTGQSVGSGR
jgi:DNA-binding MarR family transcriptional regulator